MWIAFFVLLFNAQLGGIWGSILDLPLIVQIILWIPFLPVMLGMVVWTSSLAVWVRIALVVFFAAGSILGSAASHRRKKEKEDQG